MTKRIEYLKLMMPTSGRLNPAEIKKLLKKKFMKMTKQEVVGVLLKALDYIADNEDRWHGEHFKKSKKFF